MERLMKRILAVALLFIWASAQAQIRPEHSGMWYNPDQDGHGLILEVLDGNRMAGFWFLYDMEGNPMWFLLQGEIPTEGSVIVFDSYVFYGMKMLEWDPATNERHDAGKVVVEFHDCSNITVTMTQINMLGYVVDWEPVPMERLTSVQGLECRDAGGTDWPATMDDIASEPWTLLFAESWIAETDITIAVDGTFTYGGGQWLCAYKARISISSTDPFEVELDHIWSTNDGFCLAAYDGPVTGKVYQNHEICIPDSLGAICSTHDVAMVFDTYEINEAGERALSDVDMILFR
jgi:hypothetical protein